MISKELLSEVLGVEITDISSKEQSLKRGVVSYSMIKDGFSISNCPINIYELAHKCKEWAWDLGYEVSSKKDLEDRNWYTSFRANEDLWVCRKADTEPEAIFEACQYILHNKGTE